MPMSSEDRERLPPMVPYAQVLENQRLEDLRSFRQYLVDTGAVKMLVKLNQHIVKNEMRLDNPAILRQYLENYHENNPHVEECSRLERENATLREYNSVLEAQVEELSGEVDKQRRLRVGRSLWATLTDATFWATEPGCDNLRQAGISLGQIYQRLCGCQKDDALGGRVLVELVRPAALSQAANVVISQSAFCEWLAFSASSSVHEWCRDELAERLASGEATEPPFELDLVEAIRHSPVYPKHFRELPNVIRLDKALETFFDAVVSAFAGGSET